MATPRPAPVYDCFAIAAPGLEPVVAREIAVLARGPATGVTDVREIPGGAEFRADAAALAAVQVRVRTASRVLVRLASFRATAFHELERAARKVEWARILPEAAPFRLRVTCRKSRLYHSDAVAERVADAVERAVPGARRIEGSDGDDDPDDAEPAAPQLFVVRLDRDRCTISADASGELLHRRGYRLAVARAPLRETLAAAMLLAAEWDPATPLVDPLCGSGAIPVEAAMIARRIAPGLQRDFGAERWPETPGATYANARGQARAEILPAVPAPIIGSDRDEGAIAAARANAERAGVAGDVEFRVAPLSALEPPSVSAAPGAPGALAAGSARPPRGLLIANPPYGIRVGETGPLRDLFARLGHVARERCDGWRVVLLSADRALDAEVRLPFEPILRTSNGGIPVRLIAAEVDASREANGRGGGPPSARRPARHR